MESSPHSQKLQNKNMETIVYPTFEYRKKTFSYNSRVSSFIAVDEPYAWLSDLHNIHHSSFEPLIADLEELVAGKRQEPIDFGGERAFCTAYPDKTLCMDSHDDIHIYVDNQWVLDLIKGYYEFKKPYWGGYLGEKKP